MNSKKCFVLIVTLTIFLICLNNTLWGQEQKDPNEKIKVLQEKIKQLESIVEAQQKTINELKMKLNEQIKENEKSKTSHKEDGVINDISRKTSFDPNNIVYHGKKRSRLWFDKMYEAFSQNYVCVEGKYYYKNTFENSIGEILEDKKAYAKNQIVKCGGNTLDIQQVYSVGEAAVQVTIGKDRMATFLSPIHIIGFEGPLVDGKRISVDYLVSLGAYQYTSLFGDKVTISSFKAGYFQPMTHERFAEAINSGIDIGEYEVIIKDYTTLRTLNENEYSFSENKVDGSVTIKKGDRIIKRLGKGKYHFEIIQKPITTKGR
jgi:hypothetical protein